jgi:hypothetical protein
MGRKINIFKSIANVFRSVTQSIQDIAAKQAEEARENARIFVIRQDLSRYERDNSRLVNTVNDLNNNINDTINTNEPILRRLYGKRDELNYNIKLTGDKYNKTSKDVDEINLRMTEISNINDKLQKDALDYMLTDIDTKKNIYNLIKSQNYLIKKNNLDLLNNTNKINQKYTYSLEQYNEINNINTIFFVFYYFLFIILLFFVIFKFNNSVLLKISIVLLLLIYPYIIYTVETLIYNIINLLYLYTFSIFTIEKNY